MWILCSSSIWRLRQCKHCKRHYSTSHWTGWMRMCMTWSHLSWLTNMCKTYHCLLNLVIDGNHICTGGTVERKNLSHYKDIHLTYPYFRFLSVFILTTCQDWSNRTCETSFSTSEVKQTNKKVPQQIPQKEMNRFEMYLRYFPKHKEDHKLKHTFKSI